MRQRLRQGINHLFIFLHLSILHPHGNPPFHMPYVFVMYYKTCVKTLSCEDAYMKVSLHGLRVVRCTWCCDIGADVACGGVVRRVMVIKLCVGVDVLVGILGVR
ncbi:hypothetical protein DY000_02058530 [Brassica cretica]|uniref:Secreted protein n=1 Tax=Brassica cretica TaxID=69181 RepID=A0ABQ7AUU9_BRACR|nr:hypothetical protein DY000_02058530 [Brassica cretica]